MKLFIENKELDNTVKEIRRRIRASMNGVVADSMKEKGILYKRNFGVDLPHLREMAKKYEQNHDLAQRLWSLEIRETMILATLLEPAESFNEDYAEKWLRSVNNIELVEQICMNLFSKLSYGKDFSLKLMHSDESWHQITGFTLAARLWKDFDDNQVDILIKAAFVKSDVEDYYRNKAATLLLSRLCRRSKEISEKIWTQVSSFEHSNKLHQRYMADEIANEISFLNF